MQQGAVSQWLAAPCLNGFSFLMNIVLSRAWKTENIDNDANWYANRDKNSINTAKDSL